MKIRSLTKYQRILPGKFFLPFLFFILLLFLILIWILIIVTKELPLNFSSLLSVHENNPALWIIDALPIAGILIAGYLIKMISNLKMNYDNKIDSLNKTIELYSGYTANISKGNYDFQIPAEEVNDVFREALIKLQNNLKAHKKREADEQWIIEGKDKISRILRLYTNLDELAFQVLLKLIDYTGFMLGILYLFDEDRKVLVNTATYVNNQREYLKNEFKIGEGLVGMCAQEMDYVYRTEIPDDYIKIRSDILAEAKPGALLFVPLISDENLQGILEFASIDEKIPRITIQFLLELGEIIARTVYNLKINRKTEQLLIEYQKMTAELKANELKLKENAVEMRITQEQLRRSNEQLEANLKELQNTQGKLHYLLENASEIIAIFTRDSEIIYVSPSVTHILGYSPQEMIEGKGYERLTNNDVRAFKKLIQDSIAHPEKVKMLQYSFVKKDGKKIYLESTAKYFLDNPAINGILINTRDITEKIRAEREERLKTRMQSLSENSLDLIMRLNISGQFHYANPILEDYTGFEPSTLMNKTFNEIDFVYAFKEYFTNQFKIIIDKPQKTNTEVAVPVKMGEKLTERILSIDAIPEFTNNELETILFVGHDITETKRIAKEIQVKTRNIEDSINYAQRIQSSLLPTHKHIIKHFEKSFIMFKPRDVVSGDFPWFCGKEDYTYLAVVDCTGHGVPGALLSVIGFFLLNNIIDKADHKTSAQICDMLHINLRYTLQQNSVNPETRDGMDLAFCKIHNKNHLIEFAGAHRPLYLLSKGELIEYKGDRKSIGGMTPDKKIEENFTNHFININRGDKIFLFSDGLSDQLGGPYGRKYSTKRISDNILSKPGYSMQQYYDLFESDFARWKEGFKQLDDILMIGIEF